MNSVIKHAPVGLLFAFTVKMLLAGTSPSEMGVVFALASLVGIKEYLDKNRYFSDLERTLNTKLSDVNDSSKKNLEQIQDIVAQQQKVINELKDELSTARSAFTAMKMSHGVRKVGS